METDAITTLLQEVADAVINPRFRALKSGEVHEKAPGDLVTDADREAELLITARLHDAYPGAVVLGEEATAADPHLLERFAVAAHSFTVDPVDGTRNFVHGSPDHAVMVAELRGDLVVRSWIWQPQHERAYVAELGAGAFCNGRRLTCGPASDPPRGVTSRRRWVGREVAALPALALTWASCGIDFPHLVEGSTDYLLYGGTLPWDHAPGSLLVTEAGGVARTRTGGAYDPSRTGSDGLIAANGDKTYDLVRAGISAWTS